MVDALNQYLSLRSKIEPDGGGIPPFASVGNFASGKHISRRGIRKAVDFYLLKAGLKKSELSNHALRHTVATLGYEHSHNLRAMQDMLGHADPETTTRYARLAIWQKQ